MEKQKKVMDIGELLSKGIRFEKEYKSPYYETTFKLRPLSDYELRSILIDAMGMISNEESREFWIATDEERKSIDKKSVNLREIQKADLELDALLVYTVLKDQIEGLTLEKAKQLYDIFDIAKEIDDLSKSAKEDVNFFRANGVWRKSKTIDEVQPNNPLQQLKRRDKVSVVSIESD